jgi:hypothetical protein
MSAPNQLQQNGYPGAYYLDQYVQQTVPLNSLELNAGNPNIVTLSLKYHKQGQMVMIEVDAVGANTGAVVANVSRYTSATGAIPANFRPSAAEDIIVYTYRASDGLRLPALMSCGTDGTIIIQPMIAAVWDTATYFPQGRGYYFL